MGRRRTALLVVLALCAGCGVVRQAPSEVIARETVRAVQAPSSQGVERSESERHDQRRAPSSRTWFAPPPRVFELRDPRRVTRVATPFVAISLAPASPLTPLARGPPLG